MPTNITITKGQKKKDVSFQNPREYHAQRVMTDSVLQYVVNPSIKSQANAKSSPEPGETSQDQEIQGQASQAQEAQGQGQQEQGSQTAGNKKGVAGEYNIETRHASESETLWKFLASSNSILLTQKSFLAQRSRPWLQDHEL